MIPTAAVVEARTSPFAHATCAGLLDEETAREALDWLETSAPWRLRIASFYEQHECNLHEAALPESVARLLEPSFVAEVAERMLAPITPDRLELVEINAHKLLDGQTIRIHNDFIGGEETHRVLVQLNRGWKDANGGLLMLFAGPRAEDVDRIIRPAHGSATSFEISPESFHAVSTVHAGERYTIVFTFRRTAVFAS